jgi:hypothetical protein
MPSIKKAPIHRKRSSGSRKSPRRKNIRAGENDRGQHRKTPLPVGDPPFHLLSKQLKGIPLFRLALEHGMWASREVCHGIIEMADTEAKQLQMIEDLLEIVKAQPKYKALKEPSWTPDNHPLDILQWLLKKIGPLAKGCSWTIDTYRTKSKERYRLVIYDEFNGNEFKDNWFFIPLDFLPDLKRRDVPLHDLFVDVVALVSKHNRIPLWDQDGDFSEQMHELIRDNRSDNSILARQRVLYESGAAAEYIALVRNRMRQVRIDEVKKRLLTYNASSQRKRSLIWWCKMGISLARSGKNLTPFAWVPNYMSSDAYVAPWQYYKFIWTYHSNDAVKERAFAAMRSASGSFPPMRISITYPGQKIQPLSTGDYPIWLFRFMKYGQSHLLSEYRQYYFKDRLDNPDHGDTLIEVFEQQEITNHI